MFKDTHICEKTCQPNDKANQKQLVDDDARQEFIESLRLSEGERYFYRDVNNEPNRYKMAIKSQHKYSSAELFRLANEIMISKLETLKQHLTKTAQQKIFIERDSDSK